MARRRDKGAERELAVGRIDRLLERARAEALLGRADLADRYARLSLEVARKYQTGLLRRHKAALCRACGAFQLPGQSSRTRVAAGRVVRTCLRCGEVARRPLRGRAFKKPPPVAKP